MPCGGKDAFRLVGGGCQNGVHIQMRDCPLLHQNLPIDQDRIHIGGAGEMGDPVQRHDRRPQMRLAPVQQDDVRLLADFQRSDLILQPQRPGRVDGA